MKASIVLALVLMTIGSLYGQTLPYREFKYNETVPPITKGPSFNCNGKRGFFSDPTDVTLMPGGMPTELVFLYQCGLFFQCANATMPTKVYECIGKSTMDRAFYDNYYKVCRSCSEVTAPPAMCALDTAKCPPKGPPPGP